VVRALAPRAGTTSRSSAIDARAFETSPIPDPIPDPPISADALLRYRTATRRSLTMITEETGGFVIESPNALGPGLAKIAAQMRN
jgi:hypothetical protein